MNADDASTPQLHIDSDWKNQAQAEKDKLAEVEAKAEEAAANQPAQGELPVADFKTLIGTLATNAVMSLGGMGDQGDGRVMIDLEGAKLYIDLMGVLQEKTKGNLDEEDEQYLERVIHELQMRFVDFSKAVAAQVSQGGAMPMGTPLGGPDAAGPGITGGSPIIQP